MTSTTINTPKGPPIGKAMISTPVRTVGTAGSAPRASQARDFRDVRIDSGAVAAAAGVATEMFNARDFSGIKRYVDDANNRQDGHKRSLGISMLYGIGRALSQGIYSAVRAGRVKLAGDKLPTPDELFYSLKTDSALFCAQISGILDASRKLGKASSVKFETGALGEKENNREERSAAPMKVEIVSMPRRATNVSLVHNDAGDIVAATHIEADVV